MPPDRTIATLIDNLDRLEVTANLIADPAATADIELSDAASAEEVIGLLQSAVQAMPFLLDSAEQEIENMMDDEEMKHVAMEFFQLSRKLVENFEINRNGRQLEAKISKTEGVSELPRYVRADHGRTNANLSGL